MSNLSYFLGANSESGFYSLYDNYVNQSEGNFLWILKGGAGCGKSSFMRKIGEAAEEAGFRVEYVLCSGDPGSLDGVYIPALRTAYVDGTAPHVIDARLCGADSAYLDLGRHYDRAGLEPLLPELSALKTENGECYMRAYALLKAAGAVRAAGSEFCGGCSPAALRRLENLAKREFGRAGDGSGCEKRRLLSAISCEGEVFLTESCEALCSRFYFLDGSPQAASEALSLIADRAKRAGHNIILCPDPLTPESPQAVIVPGAALGFSSSEHLPPESCPCRHVTIESRKTPDREQRREITRLKKLENRLMQEAVCQLRRAKLCHDELEKLCNSHVDFAGVYEYASKQLAILGLA